MKDTSKRRCTDEADMEEHAQRVPYTKEEGTVHHHRRGSSELGMAHRYAATNLSVPDMVTLNTINVFGDTEPKSREE